MVNKKCKTCCFTGHRKIPINQRAAIVKKLKIILRDLIEKGYLFLAQVAHLGVIQ